MATRTEVLRFSHTTLKEMPMMKFTDLVLAITLLSLALTMFEAVLAKRRPKVSGEMRACERAVKVSRERRATLTAFTVLLGLAITTALLATYAPRFPVEVLQSLFPQLSRSAATDTIMGFCLFSYVAGQLVINLCVYRLSRALGNNTGLWSSLMVAGILYPFLTVLVVAEQAMESSRLLEHNGIPVGVIGPSAQTIADLELGTMAPAA